MDRPGWSCRLFFHQRWSRMPLEKQFLPARSDPEIQTFDPGTLQPIHTRRGFSLTLGMDQAEHCLVRQKARLIVLGFLLADHRQSLIHNVLRHALLPEYKLLGTG